MAWQYERQIAALNQNYAAIQSSYAAQQAELSAQISELQDAVRMGEATVLDWRWLASPDDIVELVEHFFIDNYRGQFR